MKDKSKPGGNNGIPGSEKEVSKVREFWLSWLRTGDKPISTGPWEACNQEAASTVCKSWEETGVPWIFHSLTGPCIMVLLSCAGTVDHVSSGMLACVQDVGFISA
jgi:hypothetical protein